MTTLPTLTRQQGFPATSTHRARVGVLPRVEGVHANVGLGAEPHRGGVPRTEAHLAHR